MNTPFQNLQNQTAAATKAVREASESETQSRAYSDIPGLRHETKDVLQQLHANINHLEDLGGRLGFVLSEVRSLIRR